MPLLLLLAALTSPCTATPGEDHLTCTGPIDPLPADYGVHPLTAEQRQTMTGTVWRPGCPLGLDELSYVVVPYLDEQGMPKVGGIIIATRYAKDVEAIFQSLFDARFPIARMQPVMEYGGDDHRSMADNNTSGFNCRNGPWSHHWSDHAYGNAIDVNPLWNPQVRDSKISPPEGVAWLDRKQVRPGMAIPKGTLVKTFEAHHWHWGGRWPKPKDYQHFSAHLADLHVRK